MMDRRARRKFVNIVMLTLTGVCTVTTLLACGLVGLIRLRIR